MFLFLIELFVVKGMHKVYVEVFEYNQPSLAVIRNAGFELEGTFPDERTHQGRRWTRYCFAVYPRNIDAVVKRIGPKVLSPTTLDIWQRWSSMR